MLLNMNATNDLPFDRDASYRYVPWIIGLMVFLAILALIGTQLVANYVNNWDKSFSPGFTVEVPIVMNPLDTHDSPQLQQKQLIKSLENISGVESAKIIPHSYLSPFADPFSNEATNTILIDVTLRNNFEISSAKLKSILPPNLTMHIRDHREWRELSLAFAHTALMMGVIIACIIGLAAIATIAFVARTGLQVHKRTIEILNLIGARHDYIAQQFQNYAFKLAARGSFIGLFLTLTILFVVAWSIGITTSISFLQETNLFDFGIILLLTPLTGIFLTILSARLTVLSTLAKTGTW